MRHQRSQDAMVVLNGMDGVTPSGESFEPARRPSTETTHSSWSKSKWRNNGDDGTKSEGGGPAFGRWKSLPGIAFEEPDSPKKHAVVRSCRDAKLLEKRRRSSGFVKHRQGTPPPTASEPEQTGFSNADSCRLLLSALEAKLEQLLQSSEQHGVLLEKVFRKLAGEQYGKLQSGWKLDLASDEEGGFSSPSSEDEDISGDPSTKHRAGTPADKKCVEVVEVRQVVRSDIDVSPDQSARDVTPSDTKSTEVVEIECLSSLDKDGQRSITAPSVKEERPSSVNWLSDLNDDSPRLFPDSLQSSPRHAPESVRSASNNTTGNGIGRSNSRKTSTSGFTDVDDKPITSPANRMARRPSITSQHSAVSAFSACSSTILKTIQHATQRNKCLHQTWRLLEEPGSVKHGTMYVILMDTTILASVCFAFLQLTDDTLRQASGIRGIELAFDIFFTLETMLRFVVCPDHLAFFANFYNGVDLLAGLPPLILRVLVLTLSEQDFNDVADSILLCIVPVLRLLKFMRRFEKFHLLLKAFKLLIDALPVLLYTCSVLLLAFAAFLYLVEPRSNIPTLGWSLYATLLTLTTVGYGDVTPESTLGQFLVCLLSVVSTLYLAIPLGIIGSAFSTVWEDRDRVLLLQRTRTQLREMGLGARDIPSLFRFFDKDEDGQLSLPEFRHMVSEMKLGISPRRIIELFRLMDKDDSGGLDDAEFMRTLFPVTHAAVYIDHAICNDELAFGEFGSEFTSAARAQHATDSTCAGNF